MDFPILEQSLEALFLAQSDDGLMSRLVDADNGLDDLGIRGESMMALLPHVLGFGTSVTCAESDMPT